MNDDLGMDAEIARRNSPQFMTPTTTLPVSVVVGGTESDEFLRQSREFAAAWRTSAGVIEYVEMPDLDHFEVVEAMIKPNNLLTATILRHLEL